MPRGPRNSLSRVYQRGCKEKRLSIRFKIKKGVSEIKTFKFKNSEELTPILKKVPNTEKEKVICN